MEDKELLKKKVQEGFVPCLDNSCERREHCLRWQAREEVPTSALVTKCVNTVHPAVGTPECPMFRHDEKVRMAYGFIKLLDQLPLRVSRILMKNLIGQYHRTYAYEYRNGTRPIPPSIQAAIADICRDLGYTAPVKFDRYAEEYEW